MTVQTLAGVGVAIVGVTEGPAPGGIRPDKSPRSGP